MPQFKRHKMRSILLPIPEDKFSTERLSIYSVPNDLSRYISTFSLDEFNKGGDILAELL